MEALEQTIEALWKKRVAGQHLFHGMGKQDITDPLDPGQDPFTEVRPQLLRLIQVLDQALTAGFRFTVHEDYSGMSFDLSDILRWSRRDLADGGIDFTSSYQDACGYSENVQGSQLKQNFRYITDRLPDRRKDPALAAFMTAGDWDIVAELNAWISAGRSDHARIVLWVSRTASVFDDCAGCLPLGSFQVFSRNITAQIHRDGRPLTGSSARDVLTDEPFCYRIRQPLALDGCERIEELGCPTDCR